MALLRICLICNTLTLRLCESSGFVCIIMYFSSDAAYPRVLYAYIRQIYCCCVTTCMATQNLTLKWFVEHSSFLLIFVYFTDNKTALAYAVAMEPVQVAADVSNLASDLQVWGLQWSRVLLLCDRLLYVSYWWAIVPVVKGWLTGSSRISS